MTRITSPPFRRNNISSLHVGSFAPSAFHEGGHYSLTWGPFTLPSRLVKAQGRFNRLRLGGDPGHWPRFSEGKHELKPV